MRVVTNRADANGLIQFRASGAGFALVPAVPVKAENGDRKARPGNFPVSVNVSGGSSLDGKAIPIVNTHSLYCDGRFTLIELTDCEAGDCWALHVFEGRGEGMIAGAQKTRAAVRLQDSVAVPTVPPTLATDGFPLRVGQQAITSYFGGTPRVNTLWVRLLDGTWFNTNETVDVTAGALYDSRVLAVPGDRFAWVASGAAETVIIELAAEVG